MGNLRVLNTLLGHADLKVTESNWLWISNDLSSNAKTCKIMRLNRHRWGMHKNDRGGQDNSAGGLGEILLELLKAMIVSNN